MEPAHAGHSHVPAGRSACGTASGRLRPSSPNSPSPCRRTRSGPPAQLRRRPLSVLPDGTLVFAPLGELLVVDDGQRVLCHLCGRALRGWGRRICGHTAGPRWATGRCSGCGAAPRCARRRRSTGGGWACSGTRRVPGCATAWRWGRRWRSGELLGLSQAAQPAGSGRRRGGARRSPRSGRGSARPRPRPRLQARLVELGFRDNLGGYLGDRYVTRRRPVLEVARVLGGRQRAHSAVAGRGRGRAAPAWGSGSGAGGCAPGRSGRSCSRGQATCASTADVGSGRDVPVGAAFAGAGVVRWRRGVGGAG